MSVSCANTVHRQISHREIESYLISAYLLPKPIMNMLITSFPHRFFFPEMTEYVWKHVLKALWQSIRYT